MSASGTASLYFVSPKTTVNSNFYLNLLHEKLKLLMRVHKCSILSKMATKYLKAQKIKMFDWLGKLPRFKSNQESVVYCKK